MRRFWHEIIRKGLAFALLLFLLAPVLALAGPVYVSRDGQYLDLEHVAAYILLYGELPSNYLTKGQAQELGWVSSRGNLWEVAPGCAIGGDRFGNYEGLLPAGPYRECDVNYTGGYRQEERLIFDREGFLYYTADHYTTFTPYTVEAAEEGEEASQLLVEEDGEYLDAESVAYYLAAFGHLPSNYLTRSEARGMGWVSAEGNLWDVAPGTAIGGDVFQNREGRLPEGEYRECDVNYQGGFRGEERLVYDELGHVYYTGDSFKTFECWYGGED